MSLKRKSNVKRAEVADEVTRLHGKESPWRVEP
jgi:hypothetical protein